MENILRLALPIFTIIFFLVAFVLRTLIVKNKIGKSPITLPTDDTIYGFVGQYFKVTIFAMFIYVSFYSLCPELYIKYLAWPWFKQATISYIGMLLAVLALLFTAIAQYDMRESWRIGIDSNTTTSLITDGLFKYSRNPVYVGLITSMIALFMVTPNSFTLFYLIMGSMIIQIQTRLEEEYLEQMHGEVYAEYKGKVRRFL